VNFDLLAAEICWRVWGTPENFNGFCVLAALLHGTLVLGVSQTLRHWTDSATYIRQGGHHIGHWPTFLVVCWVSRESAICVDCEGVSFVLSCSAWTAVNHGKPLHVHQPVCSVSFTRWHCSLTWTLLCCCLWNILLTHNVYGAVTVAGGKQAVLAAFSRQSWLPSCSLTIFLRLFWQRSRGMMIQVYLSVRPSVTRVLWLIQRTYRQYFYTRWNGNHSSQMWFFVQLCSSWQDFNWLKASRGPSAIAELLVT